MNKNLFVGFLVGIFFLSKLSKSIMNSQVTVHVPPESEGCCSIHKMPLISFQGRMAASGQNEDHSIHGCSVISMLIGAHQVGMCTTGIVGEIIDRVCPTIISPFISYLSSFFYIRSTTSFSMSTVSTTCVADRFIKLDSCWSLSLF